jgi:hypothetical protein
MAPLTLSAAYSNNFIAPWSHLANNIRNPVIAARPSDGLAPIDAGGVELTGKGFFTTSEDNGANISAAYSNNFIAPWSHLANNIRNPVIAAVSGYALGDLFQRLLSAFASLPHLERSPA